MSSMKMSAHPAGHDLSLKDLVVRSVILGGLVTSACSLEPASNATIGPVPVTVQAETSPPTTTWTSDEAAGSPSAELQVSTEGDADREPDLDPNSDPVCRRPVEDYSRVEVAGETLNRRTVTMLETAMEIYDGPADLKRVAQGSYTDAVEGSFGTHDGGGAVDLSIRNPAAPAERLFDEVPAIVEALRQAGFAAWYRDWNEVSPGSVPHIHAIAIGDAELSEAARLQLDGPAGYFRGFNGLPLDPPVADGHGGALVCDWMERWALAPVY